MIRPGLIPVVVILSLCLLNIAHAGLSKKQKEACRKLCARKRCPPNCPQSYGRTWHRRSIGDDSEFEPISGARGDMSFDDYLFLKLLGHDFKKK